MARFGFVMNTDFRLSRFRCGPARWGRLIAWPLRTWRGDGASASPSRCWRTSASWLRRWCSGRRVLPARSKSSSPRSHPGDQGPAPGRARNGERRGRNAPAAAAAAPPAPKPGRSRRASGEETPKAEGPDGEDEAGPAPTSDLGAYGPAGSRLTALMRLDRLRGDRLRRARRRAADAAARPARAAGRGRDWTCSHDFDALLVATPNPLDPAVTFVAARHHLDERGSCVRC